MTERAAQPVAATIVTSFESQAAMRPGEVAVRFGDRTLTYRELNDRANQMAAHLRTYGVGRDDLVAVYMDRSIEVICAILGTLKAGAAYVPIDPAFPPARLALVLRDLSDGRDGTAPVVATQPHLVDRLPGGVRVTTLDADFAALDRYAVSNPDAPASPEDLAYVIYTSGSTGTPKGVMIEHRSLLNYVRWADETYSNGDRLTWPVFSSLAFDLAVTSIFTPLISGGRIVIYGEDDGRRGMGIVQVVEDNQADIIKLTPTHLGMIRDLDLRASRIHTFVVGGEDFKTALARDIARACGRPVAIYNEYGPTEATVGCAIHRFDQQRDRSASMSIGVPAAHATIHVLDENRRPVPPGVAGDIHIGGEGLARGYFNRPALTAQAFVTIDPSLSGQSEPMRLYRTGDLARWGVDGRLEFLGRTDDQVKIAGARIELGEIEARLLEHPDIDACVVRMVTPGTAKTPENLQSCTRCGLASNQPQTTFDAEGVCNVCRDFETYADKAQAYFRNAADLEALVSRVKAARSGKYDCLVMLSGGKDSTYMLYQLCLLGLTPLVFTLDNGFISEEAKTNIRQVVQSLGVDVVFGTTPHMNEIFVDSLKRFSNVCNGCFKTIYTLATNLAREKGLHYIFTGLSRGQFFETRLTPELFQRDDFDMGRLDTLVLEARKAYHRRPDAVSCNLDADLFRDDAVFDDIQFVDFYRYWSAPLEEMHAFLQAHTPWRRPSDTGRSTNCLINDVGIYLHKKQRGFHNYALPYSWDVRLGQKTRDAAMAELDDDIDEARVKEIIAEIGYEEPAQPDDSDLPRLVAYCVSAKALSAKDIRAHLAAALPEYMLPASFVWLDTLPLMPNGKIDRSALPAAPPAEVERTTPFVEPITETERALASMWAELLQVPSVGREDDFFDDLRGQSLVAMRVLARVRKVFGVDLSLRHLFEQPTVAGLADAIDRLSWVAPGAPTGEAGTLEEIEL